MTDRTTPAPAGMTPPRLILASSSASRQAQLRRLRLAFSVVVPDIDERPLPGEAPEAMVVRLAEAKAARVAAGHEGLVIGSDQIGLLGDRILGKPGNPQAAVEQLLALSANRLRFLSAVCLVNTRSGRRQSAVVATEVRFRRLDRKAIEAYVALDEPFDCAGAFRSESLGIALIEAMSSDDPSAILGMPLIRLVDMLAQEGVPVLAGTHSGP